MAQGSAGEPLKALGASAQSTAVCCVAVLYCICCVRALPYVVHQVYIGCCVLCCMCCMSAHHVYQCCGRSVPAGDRQARRVHLRLRQRRARCCAAPSVTLRSGQDATMSSTSRATPKQARRDSAQQRDCDATRHTFQHMMQPTRQPTIQHDSAVRYRGA